MTVRSNSPFLVPCSLFLLLLLQAGCRCPESTPSVCQVEGAPLTLPSPRGTPRLLSLARQGDTTVASWIDGEGARANVTVTRLDDRGRIVGRVEHLGAGGPPLMAAVATHQGKVAVTWMTGTPKRAKIYGAVLVNNQPLTMEVATIGPRTDPGVAFVGGQPWAIWASERAVWARPIRQDAAGPVRLVAPQQDAFWPLMVPLKDSVALTYVTARSGFDMRLARSKKVQDLSRSSTWRVPQRLHLRQVEPAMASDGADVVLAWSQVLPAAEPGKSSAPHIKMARLGAGGRLVYYDGAVKGLGPAVAPAAGGAVAVAWVRPMAAGKARLRFGMVAMTTGEPRAIRVDVADPNHGRPALVRVPGGHLLLWIRAAAKPAVREVRAAFIHCSL